MYLEDPSRRMTVTGGGEDGERDRGGRGDGSFGRLAAVTDTTLQSAEGGLARVDPLSPAFPPPPSPRTGGDSFLRFYRKKRVAPSP